MGIVGGSVGALLGFLLVQGLCETGNCGDDAPGAMLLVGGTFGGVGAAAGGFIGHFGTWRPLDTNVTVVSHGPLVTCVSHPRIEAQLGGTAGMLTESHRGLNVHPGMSDPD